MATELTVGALARAAPEPAGLQPAWSRTPTAPRAMRSGSPDRGNSLFLVGFDQQPVGIVGRNVAAEGPKFAGLDGIVERSRDNFARGIAGDSRDVGLEAHGHDRNSALDRGLRDHRLFDGHQPVVELQPVFFALLDRGFEGVMDVIVDMAADGSQVALPERLEHQPVGALGAFEETSDVERRVGGEKRANSRTGGWQK